MSSRLPLLLLVLTGCPDPTAAPEGGGMPAKPIGDGPPTGAPGQPGMGQPPGGEGGPAGGRPTPPGFKVEAGQGVKLSGTLTYGGTQTGTITIDFLKQSENSGFPDLAHTLTLEKPGPWEVEVPKGAGKFWVVSFLDTNGNGPDPSEPAGRVADAVTVEDAGISGLDITISDNPDLGDLKPGGKDGAAPGAPPPGEAGAGAPPAREGGAGAPPAGEAPPAGAGAPAAGAPPAGAPPADAPKDK